MLENFKQTHFIQQIMNTNLKTISYNITFLSDLLPEDNVTKGEVIEYKPNDLIFDAISESWLKMLLKICGNDVDVEDTTQARSLGKKEFKTDNGFKFVYEIPHKLTIFYNKSKGNIEKPDEYIKNLSNELIKMLGKKTRICKIGVNYEVFFPTEKPEEKIKNKLINQYKKDDELENGYLKLSYKINLYTKLYLVITTAKHTEKEGLYFKINFDCTKKDGTNNISDILSIENRLLEKSIEKIEKLLDLENVK
jgi:hypothetical protein